MFKILLFIIIIDRDLHTKQEKITDWTLRDNQYNITAAVLKSYQTVKLNRIDTRIVLDIDIQLIYLTSLYVPGIAPITRHTVHLNVLAIDLSQAIPQEEMCASHKVFYYQMAYLSIPCKEPILTNRIKVIIFIEENERFDAKFNWLDIYGYRKT